MDSKLIETLRNQIVSTTLTHCKNELFSKFESNFDSDTLQQIKTTLDTYFTELANVLPKEKVTTKAAASSDSASKGPSSGSSKDMAVLKDPVSGADRMCCGKSKEGKDCKNKAKFEHEGSDYCGVHIKKFNKQPDANAQPKTGKTTAVPQKGSSAFRETVDKKTTTSKYKADNFDDVDDVDI
jgi:hypothetical protein